MKIKMLGQDLELSRRHLLSDGYCLSTVKHAERLAASGDYEVKTFEGETQGAAWLREHAKYCHQCYLANAFKVKLVEWLKVHHPNMVNTWMVGKLPPGVYAEFFAVEPALVRALKEIMAFNFSLPAHQARISCDTLMQKLMEEDHPAVSSAGLAKVIRLDVEIVFQAWQLLGSAPEYDREKLANDWRGGRMSPPFPVCYFSFSEGVNAHLVRQFFDNVPSHYFGMLNVIGFLAVLEPSGKSRLVEHALCREGNAPGSLVGNPEDRLFFWAAVIRAVLDGVMKVEETAVMADPAIISGIRKQREPAIKSVESFYTVRVSDKTSFVDKARTYGRRHINWTHRWSVAGHWRTYKDGRKVWIAAYVKGPDDKPYIPSVRVYSHKRVVLVGFWNLVDRLLRFVGWKRSQGGVK